MTQTLQINDVVGSTVETTFSWERMTVYASLIAASALAWFGIWMLAMDHAAIDGGISALGPGMDALDRFTTWMGYGAVPPGSLWSEICRAVIAGGGTEADAWVPEQAALALVMWLVMAVGMMMPTAAPVIAAYSDISQAAAVKKLPHGSPVVFASGYLLIWGILGAVVTMIQWGISYFAGQAEPLLVAAPLIGAAVLIVAGLYQWSSLKEACLSQCRSPMRFFLSHWHEGAKGAIRMGMHHGLYCAGCCWALMAIMFVGGTMNLVWMAVLTVVMLLEKVVPKGHLFGRLVGVVLVGWGLGLMMPLVL